MADESAGENDPVEEVHSSVLPTKFLYPRSAYDGIKQYIAPILKRLYYDSWFCEIVATFFSAACLIALVAVLRAFEGRETPNLRWGLTLNAIIAVLATASRGFLVFSLASAVGQLKWCAFTSERRLADLQVIDGASRGVFGSILALIAFKVDALVTLGAFVTVLSMAFDPFVQQVINYPNRMVSVTSNATLMANASTFLVNPLLASFTGAVNAGIYADASQFDINPPCPSGNCTWSPFQSVGWCSKCSDITQEASILDVDGCQAVIAGHSNSTCRLSPGNGNNVTILRPSILQTYGTAGISCSRDVVWTIYRQELLDLQSDTAFYNFTASPSAEYLGIHNPSMVLGRAQIAPNDVVSHIGFPSIHKVEVCALTPCLRSYDVSVVAGQPKVDVTQIDYGTVRQVKGPHDNVSCWQIGDADIYALTEYNCNYGKGEQICAPPAWNSTVPAFCMLEEYSNEILGRVLGSSEQIYVCNGGNISRSGCESAEIITTPASDYMQRISQSGLSGVIGNIAASLTKLGLQMSEERVIGSVFRSQVDVAVNWNWLILPVLLEVGGICVLLLTIFRSHREHVRLWKSSSLALLYHGLAHETEDDGEGALEDVYGMYCAAERTRVRLNASGEGVRIQLLAAAKSPSNVAQEVVLSKTST